MPWGRPSFSLPSATRICLTNEVTFPASCLRAYGKNILFCSKGTPLHWLSKKRILNVKSRYLRKQFIGNDASIFKIVLKCVDFIGQKHVVGCPAVFPWVVKSCKYLYKERHSRLTSLFPAELSAEPAALPHLPFSSTCYRKRWTSVYLTGHFSI